MLRADNLDTFMCRLSWNLGTLASRKTQGLSRPVMGLLHLFTLLYWYVANECDLLRTLLLCPEVWEIGK